MTFEYKGKNIFYATHGRGKPVLLVNGYMETVTMWDFLVPQLQRDCQVITMDLPGHGRSDSLVGDYSMESMAELIKGLMDHLAMDQLTLCGHSLGGYIALAMADLYPKHVSKLILFHSHSFADNDTTLARREVGNTLLLKSPKTAIRASFSNLFYKHEGIERQIDFLTNEALQGEPEDYVKYSKGMAQRKDLTHVFYYDRPTFFIAGRYDPLISVEVNNKLMGFLGPNESFWLEQAGHMGHVEAPEMARSILLALLP